MLWPVQQSSGRSPPGKVWKEASTAIAARLYTFKINEAFSRLTLPLSAFALLSYVLYSWVCLCVIDIDRSDTMRGREERRRRTGKFIILISFSAQTLSWWIRLLPMQLLLMWWWWWWYSWTCSSLAVFPFPTHSMGHSMSGCGGFFFMYRDKYQHCVLCRIIVCRQFLLSFPFSFLLNNKQHATSIGRVALYSISEDHWFPFVICGLGELLLIWVVQRGSVTRGRHVGHLQYCG